ncbi:hypothetical protein [Hydrogenophaga sp. 2FB]|uniref:hypothetical protein n=1 Tax=Hydrogenophaga sp. 2FB TaxID=2502187 RepID=UPI0010F7B8A2|nr:hypothetical protein [Hydrogenophaga sp. 2FB]
MSVTCTGTEFAKFYSDPKYWISGSTDDSTWHDDAVVYVNGVQDDDIDLANVKPEDILKIEGGVVFGPVVGGAEPSLETYFKRWRKEQSTAVLMAEVPKDLVDAVKAAIIAAGGKVIG